MTTDDATVEMERADEVSTEQVVDAMLDRLQDTDKTNNPHAFVIMPFGLKPGPDDQLINFDAIYHDLIKPAIEEAGFESFRADEESVSGDILTDMFQELLLADLVVVDMSIDNANVFYELGVRHAFRKRGIVHIQCGRAYMPFDVFNVRTLPYHINTDGLPDNAHLERDKQNLVRITRDTWASDLDAVHSPIFNLLPGLSEPDKRMLRTPLATGYWREFNEWQERVAIARRQKRIGDILLLTDEIKNPLCREDAIVEAGMALRELGRHELALSEYRKALATNAKHTEFRLAEAIILNRMGRTDEAIIKLENLLADEPTEIRATVDLGRIYRTIWQDCWQAKNSLEEKKQAAFASCQWAVKSIDTYLHGFNVDLNVHEPGIKALHLSLTLVHLADELDDESDPDPDVQRIRSLIPRLQYTVEHCLDARVQRGCSEYWTWASIAELHLVRCESTRSVTRAYRKALSFARKSITRLRSSARQLAFFQSLGMFPSCCEESLTILNSEIRRIESGGVKQRRDDYPDPSSEVLAILFCGHALDRASTQPPRFPEKYASEVRRQIDQALDRAKADSNDHAFLSGAACGSDIIFIEACLERGLHAHVHMPYMEAKYISEFISYGGDSWVKRFYDIRNHPNVTLYFQEERIGRAPDGIDPYQRNARWALYASMLLGIDKLRVITLWDGISITADDEDGKRVSEMLDLAKQYGCRTDHLDITKLDHLFELNNNLLSISPNASLDIDSRVELLNQVSLFSGLHKVDQTHIAQVAEERHYEKGDYLTKQGDVGEELYIIVDGEISIRMTDKDHNECEVARSQRGDSAGELSILHTETRMASLRAESDTLVLVLSQASFREVLRQRPETNLAVTHVLSEWLIEAHQKTFDKIEKP